MSPATKKRSASKASTASRRSASKKSKSGFVWLIIAAAILILFFEARSLFVKGIEAPRFIQVQTVGQFSGTGQECGKFSAWDVTGMGKDKIVVTDSENGRILFFDRSGKFIRSYGKKGDGPRDLKEPSGIAADDSHVYFVDAWKSELTGLDANGKNNLMIPLTQSFYGPRGVAWDGQFFYVADTGTHRVVKMTPSGEILTVWGGKGMGDGKEQFDNPRSLKVDSKGLIFVADSENSRVQVLDPQGKFVRAIKVDNKVADVAVDANDRVFICSGDGNFVKVYSVDGTYIGTLTEGKGESSNVRGASGMAITSDGVLLLCSNDSVRMYRVP